MFSGLTLTEHSASVVAVVLVAVGALLLPASSHLHRPRLSRASRWVAYGAWEVALVCALFALWQQANSASRGHLSGGLARGRWLWHLERVLHLPSETWLQRLVLGHPDVVRMADLYYDTMHLSVMAVFLVWLWVRHRDAYPAVRRTLVAFTASALALQVLPVAPPRLIGGTGLVDTAAVYHQSVYAAFGDIADQYAAMPSIHVGWALLVGVAVWRSSASRWRVLGPLHAVVTCWVVVVTANHYWADGIVAAALLALGWLAQDRVSVLLRRHLLPRLPARVAAVPAAADLSAG